MKNKEQLRAVQHPCRQDHIDMISQPWYWQGQFLPLTRQAKGEKELAVIFSVHAMAHDYTVKFCNMFSLPMHHAEYEKLEGDTYTSPEDIVNNGWIVD